MSSAAKFLSTLVITLATLTCMVSFPALAQELDGKGIQVPGPKEVVEVVPNPEDGAGGAPGILALSTLGDTVATNGYQACWASYDATRDRWRLPLGDGYGRYTSSGRSPLADAYYDSADCGDGVEAGSIDHGDDLEFFLTGNYAIDAVTNDGGRVYFELRLQTACTSGCAYACSDRTDLADAAYCSSTTAGQTWREALDLEGDGDVCHRPDLVIDPTDTDWYPASADTWGYEYQVKTWVCDTDGTNCTTSTDTGCVEVDFN